MPEILSEMPSKRGKDPVYPWDQYLDGQPRKFREGVDFDCKPSSFASQARAAAKDRGMKATIRNPEDGIVALVAEQPEDESTDSTGDTLDQPTA